MTQLSLQTIAAIIVAAWLVVVALMQVAHAYWRHLDFRARYVIGAAIICFGCTLAGLLLDDVLLIIVPWTLASAGATILINYHVEAEREKAQKATQKRGELVGAARGLTQELIDRGGRSGDDRPGQNN